VKIASFNINNVRRRLPNLLDWLNQASPDVVCLQELKSTDDAFPVAALRRAGYEAVWRGEKSWNGVAILARGAAPILTRNKLPGEPRDSQSRYIEAAVNGILIASVYAPNGNPQPGPKFTYKLAWLRRLTRHAATLRRAGVPVVLAGDFNVVPTEFDIYPHHSYAKDALLQPESRDAYAALLQQGWIDAVRTLHPGQPMFTFWDYMRRRWERDAGLRLDHLLLSPDLAERLKAADVDRAVRAEPNASDHAPVWLSLRDRPRRSQSGAKAAASPQQAGKRASVKAGRPARTAGSERPLLVIDGDSFAHRSYHALPKTILRAGGKGAGAILGFANYLLRFYRETQPRAVLVAWDTLNEPTYRHESLPAYQSGRNFDDALVEQLDRIPDFVAACGFANAKAPGYEADDFLAAAVAKEERRGGRALVATGDRDAFQLASDCATILYPQKAGEIAEIGPDEVRARYGVDPRQVPDFIALRGDPSDHIPGLRGVGAPTAAALVRRYGSVEDLLKAGRFPAYVRELRLYKKIATMNSRAPTPRLDDQTPTWKRAAALAEKWELKKLAERLTALQRTLP
jgi:exodeoxyribonuclease-3